MKMSQSGGWSFARVVLPLCLGFIVGGCAVSVITSSDAVRASVRKYVIVSYLFADLPEPDVLGEITKDMMEELMPEIDNRLKFEAWADAREVS